MSRKSSTTSTVTFEPALSPEEYARILNGLELQDILLDRVEASVNRELLSSIDEIPIAIESANSYSADGVFKVATRMTVHCDHEGRSCLLVEGSYTLLFSSEEDVTPEFFEVFELLNLPLHIWPFFRELIHSMTQRMSIQPLTLPLHRAPVDADQPVK